MANGGGSTGPIGAVQGFVSNVVSTVTAPVDALNLAVAQATLEVLKFLPKMPAARLYSDLVFQFGHSHPHPPSFGVPIPSTGPVLASGCMSVLINGLPSARNGDLGLAVWCGGYFPIFEIITGSSHVFMGGARAARQVMDVTLHCLPDPLGGKWGIGKLDIAMAVFGVGMSALNTAAAVEGAVIAEEKASDAQGTADAEAAAAAAAAAGVGAGVAAAQLAADAAATAMGLLMGKDPGVGFPFGMITMGSPNVLVGGFPMPGWMTILKGLGKLLKPLIRKVQLKLPPGKARNSLCHLTGHPVDVASGRMFTSQTDFEIDGRIPISFERLYDTSAIDYESTLGWGWTHPYDQHLWESKRYNCLVLRNEENRQVRFNKLKIGERYFQPLERVWLKRIDESEYELFDCKDGLFYKFGKTTDEDFTSEKTALRLKEIFDRNGNRLELKYESNLLTEINRGTSDFLTFHYHDSAGRTRLFEIKHHLKNGQNISLMKFGYNGDSELISAANRTYVPYTYNYEDHLMTRETNRNGLSFHFAYEGEGQTARCVHTWGDGGIYERWLTYLPKAKMTKMRDGVGGEMVYHYNEFDLVTKIFNSEGGISQFEFGELGELIKETDETGRTRFYSYDEQLNIVEVIQEDGTTQKVVFDEFGDLISATDELGNESLNEYDERGNLIASIDPLKSKREFEYNRFGDLVKLRDALGNETELEYNENGLVSSFVTPRGNKFKYLYNERNFTEELFEESNGYRVLYQYDDAGRVKRISEINANKKIGGVQKFEYDDEGNLTAYLDELGNKTSFRYAGLNKIREKTDALGNKRKFIYDLEERLTELVNERGETYRFKYDTIDRIIEETGFEGATTYYKYNQGDDIVYQKDALGRETFFSYDAVGNLVRRLRSDGSSVEYSYDECGRLVSAKNSAGVIKKTFDALGNVIKEEHNGFVIENEYDAEEQRIARKISGGENIASRVEFAYDADGDMSAVKFAGREINYKRDRGGRVISKALPNGLEEKFGYDLHGYLISQKIAVGGNREIVKRNYEWNALGNVISINDSLRGARRYQYDAVERLSKIERTISERGNKIAKPETPTKSGVIPTEKRIWQADNRGSDFEQMREIEEFQYDGAGNLLERKSNLGTVRNFSYTRGNKLDQQEKIRYIYDAVGNLIEKHLSGGSVVYFEYDPDNQLTSVRDEFGERVVFVYDAFGRRISKSSAKGTVGFVWDEDVLLGEQRDVFCEYIHDDFTPLARIRNSQIENYHTDYLGTPKEVSNADGSIIWQGTYDEYGRLTDVKAVVEQPIRFEGQYEDVETGLFYNRFRYYDADAGRYITQDPIGLEGGDNFYEYGWNPLIFVDPLGLAKNNKLGKVPNKPGIYILTVPMKKTSYVGQAVDMKRRLSSSSHAKARKLLNTPGVTLQIVEVDLGKAKTRGDRRNVLAVIEQRELDRQRKKYKMLNSCDAAIPAKRARNKKLYDKHKAKARRKKTC